MNRLFFAFFLIFAFTSNTIKAQELTMFAGLFGYEFYQDDIKIERSYFKKLLSDVPGAEQSWKKANLNQGLGIGMWGVQLGFGLWLFDNEINDKNIAVPIVGFAGSALSAIVLAVRSMNHRKHAILNYNRSLQKNNIGQRLSPAKNGIGLTWSF